MNRTTTTLSPQTLHSFNGSSATSGPATDSFVVPLSEAGDLSVGLVGGKAASLARLTREDFAVPDGTVLTTAAFQAFVARADLTTDSTVAEAEQAPLPTGLDEALRTILNQVGTDPVAVRSSGVVEDGAAASYAGQYETVLNVSGLDDLRAAVQRCWVAAFADHVKSYQAGQEQEMAPMAVLVQRMVPADTAGVAFSANPITGAQDEVLVSAVNGLGDRLVSGQATPDEWSISGDTAVQRSGEEGAINGAQALEIAALALAVQGLYGHPQDIEWAMAEGQLFLLQARPITTTPALEPLRPEFEVPEGSWTRDSSHFSKPGSPMLNSFYCDVSSRAATTAFTEFGMLMERLEIKDIGGWHYLRIVPIGGGGSGAPPPWWVIGIVSRLHPGMRAAVKRAQETEKAGTGQRYVEQWWAEWRQQYYDEIERIQAVDLPLLSDTDLREHAGQTLSLLERGSTLHFQLFIPYVRAVTALIFFCRDHLNWDVAKVNELTVGLSEMSTAPARGLAELAEQAQAVPETVTLLEQIDGATLSRIAEVNPAFATAFEVYQHRFGVRPLSEDVADPTYAERPEITLALLRGHMQQTYDPATVSQEQATRRAAAAAEARADLSSSPEQIDTFDRVLAEALAIFPLREDNVFPTYYAPMGLMRYAILEIGRRLVERAQIDAVDDVFFLQWEEALDAVAQGEACQDRVLRRKRERLWSEANVGPDYYGDEPGPPPDIRALPAAARRNMEALMWFVNNDVDAPTYAGGDQVSGIAASGGSYTGPVRVVVGEADFDKIQPGDVLVCPVTSSAWSALFSNIGALVTDAGGILSHPAIIAREYGIPAILATGDGTTRLQDGQIVTVDGDSGQVRVEAG